MAEEASPEKDLGKFLEQKAVGLLFTGWYADRVYVEEIGDYRDRIKIDPGEVEVAKQLRSIHRRFKKGRAASYCGMERNGDNVSILLNWSPSSQPFGHYWFLVEHVTVEAQGLEWKLRVLRSVLQSDTSGTGKCPHCGKFPSDQTSNDASSSDPLSLADVANQLQRRFREFVNPVEWYEDAKPYLTAANLANAFKFLLVLLMALVSGAAKLLPRLLVLVNATIRESGGLVQKFMPLMLACVDMMGKVVGGFYMLLAMVWRDIRRPQQQQPLQQPPMKSLEGPRYPYRREAVQRPYFPRGSERKDFFAS